MKRGSRFLVGFTAAALTFGTLMATLGPQKFGANSHCHGGYHHAHHHAHHHSCHVD